MAQQDAVGVGLIGLGTIGTGVARVLRENAGVIAERLGFPLRLVRIADLDASRAAGVDLAGIRFDGDANALVDDPAVEIVVELIGGYDAARRLMLRAIERPQARRDRQQGAARGARQADLRGGRRAAASTWPSRRASAAASRSCARCARAWPPTASSRCTAS